MKNVKASELREKSLDELQQMLLEDQAALYQSRKDLVFRRITDTATIKVRRHNIARIMTVITEKQKGASA